MKLKGDPQAVARLLMQLRDLFQSYLAIKDAGGLDLFEPLTETDGVAARQIRERIAEGATEKQAVADGVNTIGRLIIDAERIGRLLESDDKEERDANPIK